MKNIKKLVFIFCSICGLSRALADAKQGALKETEQMQNYGRALARSLMLADFELNFLNVGAQISPKFQFMMEQTRLANARNEELGEKLMNFGNTNSMDVNNIEKSLTDLDSLWASILHETYRNSWIIADTAVSLNENFAIFQGALQKMKTTCANGRSDQQIDTTIRQGPKYIPNWSFQVQYNKSLGENNSASGGSVNLQRSNPKDPKGNEALNTISATSLIVATTTPFPANAIGGAVLLVSQAISYSMSRDAEKEVLNEQNAAELIRFNNWTRDPEIAQYYREACAEIMPHLMTAQNSLEQIAKGGAASENAVTNHKTKSNIMLIFETKLHEFDLRVCRENLRKLPADKRPPEESKNCALAKTEAELKSQEAADKLAQEKFEQATTMSDKVEYLSWKVTELMLGSKNEFTTLMKKNMTTKMGKFVTQGLVEYRAALNYLLQLKKSKIQDPNYLALVRQVELSEQLEQMRGSFIDLSATAIKVIFGREEYSVWLLAKNEYQTTFKHLLMTSKHLDEVRTLNNLYLQLVNLIENPNGGT